MLTYILHTTFLVITYLKYNSCSAVRKVSDWRLSRRWKGKTKMDL